MAESNKRAFERWRKYQSERTPMIIIKTPEDFQIDEPYSLVPRRAKKFLIGGFKNIHDAERFCKKNNLPYTLGENLE